MKLIKVNCFLILLIFIVESCGNPYEYWDTSKFKFDDSALLDTEAIRLIYSSRGPDYNNDSKSFIHIIAISEKTGDTVNILTTAYNHFNENPNIDETFNFIALDNIVSETFLNNMKIVYNNQSKESIKKQILEKISKVARDPNFDDLADNNYPTVIGFIAKITKTNNE